MRRSLVEKLACPYDTHTLTLQEFKEDDQGNILEGLFTCPHCRRYYPIVYGVPIFTPDQYREQALEQPLLARWGLQLAEGNAEVESRFRLPQ